MIFVTGDCHGDYRRFNDNIFLQQREMDRQDFVIVCGDFGYLDISTEQEYWLNWLAQKDFTILFVDGNHENHDMLSDLPEQMWQGGKVHFIRQNVIHLMRGQMFTLQGKKFFTFGGARSQDISDGILEVYDSKLKEKIKELEKRKALYRINHLTWWKEEMPSKEECIAGESCLEKHGWQCDYILSHCAPTSVQEEFSCGRFKPDDLTEYLEGLKNRCQYHKWYFGHYHEDYQMDGKHFMLYHRIMRIL